MCKIYDIFPARSSSRFCFRLALESKADNAGFDATDLLNRLRQKHAREGEAGKWFGVDVDTEGEIYFV